MAANNESNRTTAGDDRLIASVEADRCRVLVVDDDRMVRNLVARFLDDAGYRVRTAANGVEAIHILGEEGAQIVLTDWVMPEMDGLELCRAVRANESVGFVYLMILTARTETARLVEAFDAGADDFLTKPFDREELLARVRAGKRIAGLKDDLARRNREIHKANAQMAILNARLERLATTDELTGLFNRRHTMAKLDELWELANRYGHPLSCIMFDLDHFKRINDTYGHAVGDRILTSSARVAAAVARATDVIGRVGGEEFLLLCPNTDSAGAEAVAQRLRGSLAGEALHHDGREIVVTASLGVAERTDGMTGPEVLVKQADDALYRAKQAGRNCVRIASTEAVAAANQTSR